MKRHWISLNRGQHPEQVNQVAWVSACKNGSPTLKPNLTSDPNIVLSSPNAVLYAQRAALALVFFDVNAFYHA